MTSQHLFTEIRDFCEQNADEAIVKKYARYFKEGYDAYGVTRELLESKAKELVQDDSVDLHLVLETGRLLLATGKLEETSFAIYLLYSFKNEFDKSILHELDKWFSIGIDNWAHTDGICGYIFRELFRKQIIIYKDLSAWRSSPRKYQRRAVPVAMIEIFRAKGDFEGLLDFIDPLMIDQERVVHQGLGWFLREAWKRYPEPVEEFLLKWKDSSARLIFQYATEKMSKEYRERFRRSKK